MVQKYLLEIEDLRTKLYESEQECEKLRLKQRRLNQTLASPRKLFHDTVNNDDALLEAAKQEVENDKRKLEKLASAKSKINEDGDGNEDDEESESESDEDESEHEKYEAIAQLTSEISMKERLIDQLEQSYRRVESMKQHYEEKLECLNNRIKATMEERDKVMSSIKTGKRSAQVGADYEKKINEMQQEMKKWQAAQKQHVKQLRELSQYEKQISKLKSEVDTLKQTKVKLVNQSRAESAKYREIDQRRLKEINSLKKQQRTKEIKLRSLENEKNMKDQVLKRKIEEVNNLKKINKMQLSKQAQGRVNRKLGSPIKAKTKWNSLQHEIRKAVTIKSTVSSLEREMLNLIEERSEARKRLEDFKNYMIKDEMLQEDIDSTKENLAFLDDKIQEIQSQIMEVSTSAKEYDGGDLNDVEVRYMFKKLYEQNLSNTFEIDRYERRLDDSEENILQVNLIRYLQLC
jgi:chromosome segregation ATPase